MAFLDERLWFERSGARYVFRPTVFSRGYDVSEGEKDRLLSGLTRLNLRLFCEGLAWLAAVAALLLTRWIETATPLPWFVALGIIGVGALAMTGLARRDRLIGRVLGGREADVPRLPLRTAISRPRPRVSPRYAVPVLRSVVVLFWLSLAALDGAVVYLLYRAHESVQRAPGTADGARDAALLAAALSSPALWAGFIVMNAFLAFCAFLLAREVRRLASLPAAGISAHPGAPDKPV